MPEAVVSAAMTKAAIEVVGNASKPLLKKIAARLSIEIDRLNVQFLKTFEDELAKALERAKTVKTVISRDQPVDLESIYVPLTLKCGKKSNLPDISADPSAGPGLRFVLSGTGGAGKTFLMKHLLNLSRNNKNGFIPLFIELRNIQFDSGSSLEACIYNELALRGNQESQQLFKVALDEGLFVVYLDGFDEIHPSESRRALQLIKQFSDRYSSTSMLITTRPRTGVETLQRFTNFHVDPLSKEQALDLIQKTEFDQVTKSKFLREMDKNLYNKHQTLMSLPILVGMMLLTYRTYADIPDRMTVFYSQAFETLYSIHDSENKELFKRKHNAELAPDIFKKILQAFCYISLSNHDIEFSDSLLDSYLARAIKISRIEVSAQAYKSDLIHNVCILQPEGLSHVFVHRSFQEFFAAQFALNFSGTDQFRVIDQIISVSGSAVAGMMVEIDELKTRRTWALPKLDWIINHLLDLKRKRPTTQLGNLFSPVSVDSKKSTSRFSISAYNLTFHAAEILAAVVDTRITQLEMLNDIKFPSEENLIARSPEVNLSNQNSTNLVLNYDRSFSYELSSNEAWVVKESGFVENFVKYLRLLGEIRAELANSLTSYSLMEDSELFH